MKTSPSEETKNSAPKKIKDNTPAEPIDAEKFPKPNGAEKPMYTSDTNTILFHQKGTVEEQAKFYTEELAKLGWKKESTSEISDGVGWFDFKKGSLAITVTINPGRENGSITTIAQGFRCPNHWNKTTMMVTTANSGRPATCRNQRIVLE